MGPRRLDTIPTARVEAGELITLIPTTSNDNVPSNGDSSLVRTPEENQTSPDSLTPISEVLNPEPVRRFESTNQPPVDSDSTDQPTDNLTTLLVPSSTVKSEINPEPKPNSGDLNSETPDPLTQVKELTNKDSVPADIARLASKKMLMSAKPLGVDPLNKTVSNLPEAPAPAADSPPPPDQKPVVPDNPPGNPDETGPANNSIR